MSGVLVPGSQHDCFCVTHDRGPKEVEEMDLEECQIELRCWRRGELYRGYDRIRALEVPNLKAKIAELETSRAATPSAGDGGELERHRDAIRNALSNLGEPQPSTPAPVAEAHRILLYAIFNEQCPQCDMGENTGCICPPQSPTAPVHEAVCGECGIVGWTKDGQHCGKPMKRPKEERS